MPAKGACWPEICYRRAFATSQSTHNLRLKSAVGGGPQSGIEHPICCGDEGGYVEVLLLWHVALQFERGSKLEEPARISVADLNHAAGWLGNVESEVSSPSKFG